MMAQSTSQAWKQAIYDLTPESDLDAWTTSFTDMVASAVSGLNLVGVTPPPSFNFQSSTFKAGLQSISADAGNGFAMLGLAFNNSAVASNFAGGSLTVGGTPVNVTSIVCVASSAVTGKAKIENTDPTPATGETTQEVINNINLGKSFFDAFGGLTFLITGTLSNGNPFTSTVGVQ